MKTRDERESNKNARTRDGTEDRTIRQRKKTQNNMERITISITRNGTQCWPSPKTRPDTESNPHIHTQNTALHGNDATSTNETRNDTEQAIKIKNKSRHYMEHWGPHQTKHGTTRNNKSTLTQRTALHRNICGICTDHMF